MKKRKRIKEERYETDEQQEIKRFIIILLVVVASVIAVYLFTKYVVKRPRVDMSETTTEGQIDYSVVTIGTMLGKKDSNYYVIIYDSESKASPVYSNISGMYASKENALPMYYCDLNNALNKEYIAKDKTNPEAKSIKELALGEITLIKVSNGKIAKYVEGLEKIKKELGI